MSEPPRPIWKLLAAAKHPADATVFATQAEFPFGEGKISGVLAVLLGWLGLGAVIALRAPQYLSTPELRGLYAMPYLRTSIDVVLFAALLLGVVSLVLSERRSRGLIGIGLSAGAMLLGGSRVPIAPDFANTPYLALDWFLLSLLGLALIFVPLERAFARVEQRVFRKGWRTDLVYFGVSHLLMQVTVFLTMLPAAVLLRWAVSDGFQNAVAGQPLWLQFLEAMFVADLFAYVAHRLFHEIPVLWRFHAIHHSSEEMDWLASSRLHIVDIVVTRAFGFIPLYILGFSQTALVAYLTWASFQAIFIHSNVRFRFGPLRYLLATPQFHHWHHSATLYNKNFAVHLPFIDMLFGTFHMPGTQWPPEYGLGGSPMPDGYLSQLVYPFTGAPADEEAPNAPEQAALSDPAAAPTVTSAVTGDRGVRLGGRTPGALEFLGRGSSYLAGETRDLLRDRMARIAVLIAVGLTLFLVRDTLLPEQAYLPSFRAVLIAAYAAIGLLLRGDRAISLQQLRMLETGMLWSLSGWFAVDRIFWMEARAEAGDAMEVMFTVDFSVLVYVSFITAYAVFIPNRWPRAVLITLPLTILPAAIASIVLARHPQHADLLAAGLTPTRTTSLALMLLLALAFAGFGARLIHKLRAQAWEARELGPYRLIEKIGEGSMGEVWKAEHKLLPRPAAIKLVRADLIHARSGLEAQEVLRRFEREVRATSNLRSPHTVEIYDFGVTDELVFYYVMELLDGLDLKSLVLRDGPLPDGRVVHLLLQACESLDEAHSAGLVHRDIKPANIFACKLGNRYDYVKVLDFGLVAAADPGMEETAQVRGGVAGTPAYMAPEILRAEPFIDQRADIYALGCVGYWLLTGSLVFAETTAADMARAHLERTPQRPGERRGYPVDDDLEEAILACLHKKPADRPATADELARRLRASAPHGSWSRTAARDWWERHDEQSPPSVS